MWPNPQFPAHLGTFTKEIHFLCSDEYETEKVCNLYIHFTHEASSMVFWSNVTRWYEKKYSVRKNQIQKDVVKSVSVI